MLRGQRLISWDAVAITNILFYLDLLPQSWPRRFCLESSTSSRIPRDWTAVVNPGDITGSVYNLWRGRQNLCHRRIQPLVSISTFTPSETLFENMKQFGALQCSNPRDRIFALLSVSSDVDRLDIVPDYTRKVADIFLRASISILSQSDNLEPLITICRWDNNSEDYGKLPSWAINLPRPFDRESRTMDRIKDGSVATHPNPQTKLHFESGDRQLVLRGSFVGCIAATSPPSYGSISWALDLEDAEAILVELRLLSTWTGLLLRTAKTVTIDDVIGLYSCLAMRPDQIPRDELGYLDKPEIIREVWVFLRESRNYIRRWPEISSIGSEVEETLSQIRDVILQLARFLLCEDDFSKFNPDAEITDAEQATFRRILDVIVWRGRSIGITQCGKFFSALNRTQVGDLIAALEGSTDRLWTIRPGPDGRSYRLVGDINVHGFMQGEIYKDRSPDDVDIALRIV